MLEEIGKGTMEDSRDQRFLRDHSILTHSLGASGNWKAIHSSNFIDSSVVQDEMI